MTTRTSKTISISLPPAQLRQALRLARRENRTMSELIREALRRYEQPSASANTAAEWATALARLRANAVSAGSNKLSNREINREIAAVRKLSRKHR